MMRMHPQNTVLLALALTAASLTLVAVGVHAQSASLWVQLGGAPHWTTVSGTRVEVLPESGRPGYDVFRYGGAYYAYSDGRWYTSRRESGQFTWIDDRSVPVELTSVPSERWRGDPSSGQSSYGGATLRVTFGTRPRWTMVEGTRVMVVPETDRPDYDVFRFGGSYYAYANGRWYTSDREEGDFRQTDENTVPDELMQVPRDRWRSYPTSWRGRYDSNSDRDYGNRQGQGTYSGDRGSYRDDRDQGYGTITVEFRHRPHWERVRGTRVRMIRESDRPDYDMFSYAGLYYVYNSGSWYASSNWRGSFRRIDEREVPDELSRVPRDEWRSYPATWSGNYGNRDDRRHHRDDRYQR